MQTIEQAQRISKDLALTPIAEVLGHVAPAPFSPTKSTQTAKTTLDEMFPEQERLNKQVNQAKSILGDIAKEFSTSELQDIVSEIQFLADSWLDNYEREIFDGLTLNELLHEKGG